MYRVKDTTIKTKPRLLNEDIFYNHEWDYKPLKDNTKLSPLVDLHKFPGGEEIGNTIVAGGTSQIVLWVGGLLLLLLIIKK